MKKIKHNEQTSTIFFDSNQEFENFKENLAKKGFIKFDPENEIEN